MYNYLSNLTSIAFVRTQRNIQVYWILRSTCKNCYSSQSSSHCGEKDAMRRDAWASPRLMRQLYAALWLRVCDARAISLARCYVERVTSVTNRIIMPSALSGWCDSAVPELIEYRSHDILSWSITLWDNRYANLDR